MQKLFNRNLVASAVGLALVAGASTLYVNSTQSPAVTLSADQQAFLAQKQQKKETNPKRYDKPHEAMEFYAEQRAPLGSNLIPHHKYGQALEHMRGMARYSIKDDAMLAPSNVLAKQSDPAGPGVIQQWENLGPGNIGGRTRALIIDPVNPDVMYAAGVAGGVWKSTNAGGAWAPLDDAMVNLAVTTMAMSHADNKVIYAGTGEGFFNIDSIRGDGIFMSDNAGATWSQLESTASNDDFRYVNKIAISPVDENRLYAATRGGLMRSTDGGASWTKLMESDAAAGCLEIALAPNGEHDTVILSCGSFTGGTVYHSADNGDTITAVIEDELLGRTTLAIAPSDHNIVYAFGSSNENDESQFRYGFHKLFRSNDGGMTWEVTTSNQSENILNTLLLSNPVFGLFPECGFGANRAYYNQGWYDNTIAVDPVNPDSVWVGGIDLFRSDDGGQNFDAVSRWWADINASVYAHADQHTIVFHPNYDGVNNKTLYVGNDGGIQRTDNADGVRLGVAGICSVPVDGSVDWVGLNNNYAITQFYHGAVYPDGSAFLGGTQDNGTLRGYQATGNLWDEVAGGDGGWVAIDPRDPRVIYTEFTGLSLQRFDPDAGRFVDATAGIEGGGFPFITPYMMDSNNPDRLWIGNDRLWRTDSRGDLWVQASAPLAEVPDSTRTHIASEWAVAMGNSEHVMAGTNLGYVAYTDAASSANAETVWNQVEVVAGGYISDVAIDPVDHNIAYATNSRFGSAHIFKTMDGGATWMAIDNMGAMNGLPDIPANTIVIDPTNTSRLFVGTDLGVFVSVDGGMNWSVDGSGFANTPVAHLEINNGELYAFTHGRSAYKVDLSNLPAAKVAHVMGYEDSSIAIPADSYTFSGGQPEFDALVLSALPAHGTLMNGDAAIEQLAPIPVADLANLSFMPEADFYGDVSVQWYAAANGQMTSTSNQLMISVASVNDAPMFELDQSVINMPNTNTFARSVMVNAGSVPANEADQTVTYSLSPESADFLTVEFDSATGQLDVTPVAGASGSAEFTITADDGQSENNTYSKTVTVNSLTPVAAPEVRTTTSGGGGSSMGIFALLALPLLALRRRFKA